MEAAAAETHEALFDFVRVLARATARASVQAGVRFDIDDPDVAREIIMVTFDALVRTPPRR